MITKLEKFTQEIREGKHSTKGYQYSQLLKSARIKNNLTLEEVAKGICSVSYLCKVENQQLYPGNEYVKPLLERVDLDYESLILKEYSSEFKKAIKSYLYSDFDCISYIYNMVSNEEGNANVLLIRCIYFLMTKKFQDFKDTISILDSIKKSLENNQSILLIFLVAEYYYAIGKINEAHRYALCLEIIKVEDMDLNILILEQKIKVSFYKKDFPRLFIYYKMYNDYVYLGYPNERKLIIDLIMCEFKAEAFKDECLDATKRISVDNCCEYDKLNILYHKYLVLLKINQYNTVYVDIINNYLYKDDNRFLSLLAYIVYKNPEKVKQLEFIKNIENISLDEEDINIKFIKFVKNKIQIGKSYDFIEFIKYEVIPFSKQYYHPLFNKIYSKEYIKALCKLSKYKDATLYLSE